MKWKETCTRITKMSPELLAQLQELADKATDCDSIWGLAVPCLTDAFGPHKCRSKRKQCHVYRWAKAMFTPQREFQYVEVTCLSPHALKQAQKWLNSQRVP